ncbi:MAG: transposase [Methylibium sp.]|nr:transposase [Methylibium sp.]
MARPPRIEFAGAVYHVASQSPLGSRVFVDDIDRALMLDLLSRALRRFDAQALAFSLANDHYQLLLFTRQANLSRLMRHLNGVYTQAFNRRHGRRGAVFQGRFKATLVDRENLLLDACRYVDLSAQRLRLVRRGADWPWHSQGAHIGASEAPPWLDVDGLLSHLLSRELRSAADRRRAADRYARLLAAEPDLDIWAHLRHQIFLGDEAFAARMLAQGGAPAPRQRPPGTSLASWRREDRSRSEALYLAHTQGGVTMTALARELGLSVSRVSRMIASHEHRPPA